MNVNEWKIVLDPSINSSSIFPTFVGNKKAMVLDLANHVFYNFQNSWLLLHIAGALKNLYKSEMMTLIY